MAVPGSPTSLYRALLRVARNYNGYNIREYIIRRSRQGFEHSQGLAEQEQGEAFKFGLQQLEVAKRQAVLSQLYPPRVKNIMELGV